MLVSGQFLRVTLEGCWVGTFPEELARNGLIPENSGLPAGGYFADIEKSGFLSKALPDIKKKNASNPWFLWDQAFSEQFPPATLEGCLVPELTLRKWPETAGPQRNPGCWQVGILQKNIRLVIQSPA